jgi:hypothetical protein
VLPQPSSNCAQVVALKELPGRARLDGKKSSGPSGSGHRGLKSIAARNLPGPQSSQKPARALFR